MSDARDGQESWEDVGDGSLVKFDRPVTLVGVLKALIPATKDSKYGSPQVQMVLDDGTSVAAYAPKILARKLGDIPPGTRIRIVYDGTTVRTQTGQMAKQFTVQVAKAK